MRHAFGENNSSLPRIEVCSRAVADLLFSGPDGSLVEDEPSSASAHLRGRMNVAAERFGNSALDVARQAQAVMMPEPVGDALSLKGHKAP